MIPCLARPFLSGHVTVVSVYTYTCTHTAQFTFTHALLIDDIIIYYSCILYIITAVCSRHLKC